MRATETTNCREQPVFRPENAPANQGGEKSEHRIERRLLLRISDSSSIGFRISDFGFLHPELRTIEYIAAFIAVQALIRSVFKYGCNGAGNRHAAVRLLMRFDQRDEQPRERRAAAVQDVRKFIFAALAS